MVTEVVPGVSWYDTFYDAVVGSATPVGWTKYGAGAIAIEADSMAYGGKAIRVANDAAVGLGLNIAGSPADFEVAMRFRSSAESELFNPVSYFGGPAGRIVAGAHLGGVMVGVECTAFVMTCEFFCSLGYVTGEYPDWAGQIHSRGSPNRSFLYTGKGDAAMGSIATHGRSIGGNGTYYEDVPAYFLVPGPNGTICSSQFRQGLIAGAYSWARMKIVGGKVSFKSWMGLEPATWDEENLSIISAYWPAAAGPVGFLSTHSTALSIYAPCYAGQDGDQVATFVDMISVSLDPVGNPAYIPDPVNITSTCPLPSAKRGEAYSYQIESTVPAP